MPEETKKGVGIISFSGDKLLGGPQAGIILGRRTLVEAMKKNPLTRALRPDKFTLAALEATLLLYLDKDKGETGDPCPPHAPPGPGRAEEEGRQGRPGVRKGTPGVGVEVVKLSSEVGGGSLPDVSIPSYGLVAAARAISVEKLEQRMRGLDVPVIGRIEKGRFLIDMRTVQEEDEPTWPSPAYRQPSGMEDKFRLTLRHRQRKN